MCCSINSSINTAVESFATQVFGNDYLKTSIVELFLGIIFIVLVLASIVVEAITAHSLFSYLPFIIIILIISIALIVGHKIQLFKRIKVASQNASQNTGVRTNQLTNADLREYLRKKNQMITLVGAPIQVIILALFAIASIPAGTSSVLCIALSFPSALLSLFASFYVANILVGLFAYKLVEEELIILAKYT